MLGPRTLRLALLLLALLPGLAGAQASEPKVANLGTCPLENGQVIRDCRLAYRTAGRLNADRSNAVLFPTWFSGNSNGIINLLGPGELVDTTKYHVIAVDAFGNGVSSSPSNSPTQRDSLFPQYSIRDMVRAEHRLVTEVLGLSHLHAVMGISMGGMQTFEWITTYPTFMDKAVSIVGSPQLASWDILLWDTMLEALEQCLAAPCQSPTGLYRRLMTMANHTPQERSRMTSRDSVERFMEGLDEVRPTFNAYNTMGQLKAMIGHDVSQPFGGSMERARQAVRAELLVVSSIQDHVVRPEPAQAFAKAIGAQTWDTTHDCGHSVFSCDTGTMGAVINAFLDRPRARGSTSAR